MAPDKRNDKAEHVHLIYNQIKWTCKREMQPGSNHITEGSQDNIKQLLLSFTRSNLIFIDNKPNMLHAYFLCACVKTNRFFLKQSPFLQIPMGKKHMQEMEGKLYQQRLLTKETRVSLSLDLALTQNNEIRFPVSLLL